MLNKKNIPWCEKYRAKNFSEIKGQTFAIEKVKAFLKNFPKKKVLILHGAPGIGKTSLAYALANEENAEILEMNASDFRNKEKIHSVIGPAIKQKSLFKEKKFILVDEVDGISARRDRGGLAELLALIEKSVFPIIITANDIWNKKFSLLRKKGDLVGLKEVEYKEVLEVLVEVCNKEGCQINKDLLTSVAIKAKGDIRAALNDFQIIGTMDVPELMKEVGERNKEESIFSALQHIFKNSKIDDKMIKIFDEVNMPIDEVFLWIEENIPLEYKGEELAKAYDALSRADVFRGRIYRQQHWRFMVYEYFLLGAGIGGVKRYNRDGWTNYKKPTRILKIWLQNQRAAKKKTICQKYAKECHISVKKAMRDFLTIKLILQNHDIRKQLKLNTEEIDYLDKPL